MNTLFPSLSKLAKSPFITAFLFFTLLFSGTAIAQTVGNSNLSCDISRRNPCTSKDLEIVSVAIDAPACTSCTPGQPATFPLNMTIHNGTKSERTSFVLYGTLSSGASINGKSGNIVICVGPITVKSDELRPGESAPGNQTFAVGTITFTCGQDLTLSNNFLAWTDASGTTSDRCNTFLAATKCSDIAPKCGTAESITIVGPVGPPACGKVDPTCTTATGKVTVTSTTTGFTFSLDGAAFEPYPSGGWTVNSGEHCVRAKRTSDGCISTATCITIPAAPANPDRPVVTLQEATICGTNATPTVTVCNPIAGTYKLNQTGQAEQSLTYPATATIRFNVVPGKGPGGFTLTVTTSAGCTSPAATCSNAVNSCPAAKPAQAITTQSVKPLTSVLAAPNPFNDRIKFSLKSGVSGQGSFDLYNLLGQKVKTIYQGYIEKGKMQTIEYSVPNAQRTNLIYMFRVGNQRTSGKLIQLK